MDAFVSRKRRKLESTEQREGDYLSRPRDEGAENGQETDSTEYKLATLASLHANVSQDLIMEALISSAGSVGAASKWLDAISCPPLSLEPPITAKIADRQSSLASFTLQRSDPNSSITTQSVPPSLTKKGQTLHLYTPEDIALHTPCSIIHNFLEKATADELLKELLDEAPTFERQTFKLFDHVVQSPHSACFYVESLEEQKRQRTEYLYNGSYLTVGNYPGHGGHRRLIVLTVS